jgi:hypothetical protein
MLDHRDVTLGRHAAPRHRCEPARSRRYLPGQVLFGFALTCLCAGPLAAQTRESPGIEPPTYSISLDNDFLVGWAVGHGTDFEYTHGAHVRIRGPHRWRTEFEIGQELYTPRWNLDFVLEGARPHAGLLYGAARTYFSAAGLRHQVTVLGGVIGPAAGGEPLQRFMHHVFPTMQRLGWEHQIETTPALQLAWTAERPLLALTALPGPVIHMELTPQLELQGGTLYRSAQAAARAELTLGSAWPFRQSGAHRAPGTPASSVTLPRGAAITLWARAGTRWVQHNALLTDRVYGDTQPSTVPLSRIPNYTLGIALRLGRYAIEYSGTRRGREYAWEPTSFTYGTLSFARW